MSATRRIAFGAVAHWVSRGMTIILGLVLMPVLLRHLPKEEVGLWVLLGQSWAVMGILDLGFGATLIRRIALVKGKSGGDVSAALNETSHAEIADLIASAKHIYRWMAFAVFVVAFGAGFYYLSNLKLTETPATVVWIAWGILCLCQAITVWQSVWLCVLQGIGLVGWDALLAVICNAGMLLIQITVVMLGGGIISLAIVATVISLIQRGLMLRFIRRQAPELFSLQGKWNPQVLGGMPSLALRAWMTSLGSVLVYNTDSFFIVSKEGAGNVPAYRAAFLVALNLHVMAGVFVQSSSVFISQLWQAGQLAEVQRIFQRNLKLGWLIMACGGVAVFFSGDSLFNVWLGQGNYVGPMVVGVLLLTFLLEQQSFIIATSCRATEIEPFAFAMIAGGILKLILAVPLINKWGMLGLALAALLSQMSTAYVSVLRRGLSRLEYPFGRYMRSVVLPGILVLIVTALACLLIKRWLIGTADLLILSGVSLVAAGILSAAIWGLVFEPAQRTLLLRRLGWK